MNEFERKIRQLISPLSTRLAQWWGSSARTVRAKRSEGAAALRHEAAVRAQHAAARARDLRDTETARKAASALHDLREHEAAKKAEAKLNDLRGSETARRAESALADLRQREPVRKAEENARKVLHDLFSGGKDAAQG